MKNKYEFKEGIERHCSVCGKLMHIKKVKRFNTVTGKRIDEFYIYCPWFILGHDDKSRIPGDLVQIKRKER